MKARDLDKLFEILPDGTRRGEGWDQIKALNTWKQELSGKPFTKKHFLNGLKNCGIPCSENFWSALRSTNILQPTEEAGLYNFGSTEPICWKNLLSVYKIDQSRNRIRNRRFSANKVKEPAEAEPVVAVPEKTEEEKAIELLKSKGYRIFSPVATVYEEI